MPFEIIWTNKAKKDLKLIDAHIADRIIGRIDEIVKEETVFLEKVKGQDFYKYRVGSYRVFIEKLPATRKLIILHVRHRKNAYKNL